MTLKFFECILTTNKKNACKHPHNQDYSQLNKRLSCRCQNATLGSEGTSRQSAFINLGVFLSYHLLYFKDSKIIWLLRAFRHGITLFAVDYS